jgi:hypothetical protein
MQLELPFFSSWHQCLDIAQHPAREEPCDLVNMDLWSLWCRMKNRPTNNHWGLWTEKDVVDWINCHIQNENDVQASLRAKMMEERTNG